MGLLQQPDPTQVAQPPVQSQVPQGQPPTGAPPQQLDPAALQDRVHKIVLAAQHVMYAPEMRDKFIQSVKSKLAVMPAPAAAALLAINLILVLIGQSGFKMNPQAIVPAGIMITGEILSFIEKATKVNITPEDSHKAIELFTKGILAKVSQKQQQIQAGGQNA